MNNQLKEIDYIEQEGMIEIGKLKETASNYWKASDYLMAKEYTEIVLQKARDISNSELIGRAYFSLGTILNKLNDYEEAFCKFNEALKVFKDLNDKKLVGETLNNIGFIYIVTGNYIEAEKKFIDLIDHNPEYLRAYTNLAIVYQKMKRPEKALTVALKSLELLTSKPEADHKSLAVSYNAITELYLNLNQVDQAKKYIQKMIEILKDLDNEKQVFCLQMVAKIYIFQNNYVKAEKYLAIALSKAQDIQNLGCKVDIYGNFAYLYEKSGNYELSHCYQKKQLKYEKQLFKMRLSEKINRIKAEHKREINELKKNQLLEITSYFSSAYLLAIELGKGINQPLNSIKVNAHNILYKEERYPGSVPEHIIKDIESLVLNIEEIRELWIEVVELLDPSCMSDVERRNDIVEVIQPVFSVFKKICDQYGITIEFYNYLQETKIHCSKMQIKQIFIYFVMNSIFSFFNYHHKEKSIKIEIRNKEKELLELSIYDNRPYIDKDLKNFIIHPEFQEDKSNYLITGLLITRELINNIGGSIEIRELEQGICFSIFFMKRD